MADFCIVILAAGEGKRMKSDLPKVMHALCGRPMVNHVVEAARKMAPRKIIVVVGRKKAEVKSILGRDIRVVYQENPLGTADAVKAARREIPPKIKDVIILYGDTPLVKEATIRRLLDLHRAEGVSCTILTTFLDNPRGYGRILRNEAGLFIGVIEDKDATYPQKAIKEINTGMYCFKKDDLLNGLEHVRPLNRTGEFYLTDVFGWLFNKNKKIAVCTADDPTEVLGVNSQAELRAAALIMRQRILERHAEAGVSIGDFHSIFIDETARIGAGTAILPFTVIERNVIIGRDCRVGPFCHLREGSVLADEVSVGNFTEIKNSHLNEGSRVRHVSYIGDTRLGKHVNIGAGTVVANFDGRRKHRTVIKDRAFVGCDTVLIAPVVVGRNAVVGAGSVVTKDHDVPDNAVVVGVPARVMKRKKR